MKAIIQHRSGPIEVDLSEAIDVSLPLKNGTDNPNAWGSIPVTIEPVRSGSWVGEVKQGAPVNFRNISFNPHGNGTHTECLGHISKEDVSINKCLTTFFFLAEVVSIMPAKNSAGDEIILKSQLIEAMSHRNVEALLIRTLPNDASKKSRQYTGTNPPYIESEALKHLRINGIKHLLVDLPSVDREHDEGKLLAHHAFWNYPENPIFDATITEFIFIPDTIPDGRYFLNIQIASFENDASPSKILLFKIK